MCIICIICRFLSNRITTCLSNFKSQCLKLKRYLYVIVLSDSSGGDRPFMNAINAVYRCAWNLLLIFIILNKTVLAYKRITQAPWLKNFFILRLFLRTRSLCFTEYDTKNWGFKSFGVGSPLSLIWNTYIVTYGVVRDCFKKRTNLDIF